MITLDPRALKICCRCKAEKPVTQFSKDRRKPNGIAYACRECERKRQRDYLQNAGVLRRMALHARSRYWDSPETDRARRSKYRQEHTEPLAFERNPFKERARRELRTAVRMGQVIKPTLCQDCGAGGIIHGHHEDYARPLDVDWLCPKCHGLRHQKHTDSGEDRRHG